MKFNPFLLAAVLSLTALSACNQNSSSSESGTSDGKVPVENVQATASASQTAPFSQGSIDVRITTPGSALGGLLQQVDPTKGNIAAQLKKLAAKLSAKERAQLESQGQKAGIMNLAVIMLPMKSVIFIKGKQATAKFDALTFHGENTVNDAKRQGMIYVKSQNSAKSMTVSYTGDSFDEMAQNPLKATDYSITKTRETSIIAGYLCHKNIYTLKKTQPSNPGPGSFPNATIYQLEVWSSREMPKSVNFLHPLYINEEAGIMKILIQYQKENPLKILYEFTKVDQRTVSEEEMQIKTTPKIHDFSKDKATLGMEMMGIVFGM